MIGGCARGYDVTRNLRAKPLPFCSGARGSSLGVDHGRLIALVIADYVVTASGVWALIKLGLLKAIAPTRMNQIH